MKLFDPSKVVQTDDFQPFIRTRDGKKMKNLYLVGGGHWSADLYFEDGHSGIYAWNVDGSFVIKTLEHELDLVCIEEEGPLKPLPIELPDPHDQHLYEQFLIHAPEMPDWYVGDLPMLSEADRESIFFGWRRNYAKHMVEITKEGMK